MKIKTIAVLGAAAVMLCGCGNNGSSNSQSSEGERAEISVPTPDSPVKNVVTIAPFTKANIVTQPPTKAVFETSISGRMDIGINMKTPKGINIYNGSEERTISPSVIPTSESPLSVSDGEGNSVNIFASAGIDYSEFDGLGKEEAEKMYFDSVKEPLDSPEVTSYTTGTYDNHKGIRMDISAKRDGADIKQTVLMINSVRENTDMGYCYTVAYTDADGDMQDAIEESIPTIKVTAGLLYAMYETPEECAQAQKDGSFDIADGSKYRFKTPGNLFKTDGTPVELP